MADVIPFPGVKIHVLPTPAAPKKHDPNEDILLRINGVPASKGEITDADRVQDPNVR